MSKKLMPIWLAIDTSCDDTSASVTSGRQAWSSVIASQTDLHRPYGGVFPTLAKQAHRQNIGPVVKLALQRAQIKPAQLTGIAVTSGPGLAPALEIGLDYAKQLATTWHKPLLPINHLEGHALSVLIQPRTSKKARPRLHLSTELKWPVLSLVMSGGHSSFILINQPGQYQILGETLDDALGEALDKVGRLLNLGYPAGPVMEQLALLGNPNRFKFPLPLTTTKTYNLSFSGLKTAASQLIARLGSTELTAADIQDLAASWQQAAFRHLLYKLAKILTDHPEIKEVWLGGGVASNLTLRRELRQLLKKYQLKLKVPGKKNWCTDNAAMIGLAASLHQVSQAITAQQLAKIDRQPDWSLATVKY